MLTDAPDTDPSLDTSSAAPAHLAALRTDFDAHAGRSLALPVAGATVWSAIGAAALILPAPTATLVLLFGTGAIFPLVLAVARGLGERLLDNPSPLAALMGRDAASQPRTPRRAGDSARNGLTGTRGARRLGP